MRHQNSGKALGRNTAHRKAMFQNMIVSLIRHELIKTTVIKAKELRRFAEPIITLAKEDTLHNRRVAYSRLRDKEIIHKLFTEIGPFYKERTGGYLRILKCDYRNGDNAPMAIVELVARREEESAS